MMSPHKHRREGGITHLGAEEAVDGRGSEVCELEA